MKENKEDRRNGGRKKKGVKEGGRESVVVGTEKDQKSLVPRGSLSTIIPG
jgi:hypothetical protein